MNHGNTAHPIESVLVVEDNPLALKFICDFLKALNVELIGRAINAEDALDILETQPFSFIITDYRLPGLNGVQFLEKIRARGIQTPVIILSSSPETNSVIRASRFERVDFFSKPFHTAELTQAIAKLATV
jgi:DNA-binding response OmpR family regulator